MYELAVNIAEFVSTLLTVPTIILAAGVIWYWRRDAARSIFKKRKRDSEDWLIAGIFIGFLGAFFDNLYWGAAWSSEVVKSDWKPVLFACGVIANIPFRQLAGILAAYCHLRAFMDMRQGNGVSHLNKILLLSLVCGVAYTVLLLVYKQ